MPVKLLQYYRLPKTPCKTNNGTPQIYLYNSFFFVRSAKTNPSKETIESKTIVWSKTQTQI